MEGGEERERLTVVTDREAERCVLPPTTPTPPPLSLSSFLSIIFSLLRLHLPLYFLSPPSFSSLSASLPSPAARLLSPHPPPSPPPPFRHRTSRVCSPRRKKKEAKDTNQAGQQRDVLAIHSRYSEMFLPPNSLLF